MNGEIIRTLARSAGFAFIISTAPGTFYSQPPPPPWCSQCAGVIGTGKDNKRWCWNCQRIDNHGEWWRAGRSRS